MCLGRLCKTLQGHSFASRFSQADTDAHCASRKDETQKSCFIIVLNVFMFAKISSGQTCSRVTRFTHGSNFTNFLQRFSSGALIVFNLVAPTEPIYVIYIFN